MMEVFVGVCAPDFVMLTPNVSVSDCVILNACVGVFVSDVMLNAFVAVYVPEGVMVNACV